MKNLLSQKGNIPAIVMGVLAQLLTLVIGAVIVSCLVSVQQIAPEYCRYFVMPILVISGMIGPVVTWRMAGKNGNAITMLTCTIISIMLQLLMGIVVFDAVVGNVVVNLLCILAGTGIAYAICIRRGGSHKKRMSAFW